MNYSRLRNDGWPYCPYCGEDELYSLAIPATIETIASCYRCGWTPARAESSSATRPASERHGQ
jgi:hypothetical protein